MTHVHNVLNRILNSIVQQAPYIASSDQPGYVEQDVEDLLEFTAIFVDFIKGHHYHEESCLFPEIEALAGQPGLMDDPKHQHDTFSPGLDRLAEYCKVCSPRDYRWKGPGGMKEIIDSFGQPLYEHLVAEVEALLTLTHLDSDGLRACWTKFEAQARKAGIRTGLVSCTSVLIALQDPILTRITQYSTFPIVLGNCDRLYEGGQTWPNVPNVLELIVRYWTARGTSVWRFNSCDLYGHPQPLHFVPQA